MPRKLNPGDLKTGHGKQAPDEVAPRPALEGAGLVGPGPNIGQGTETGIYSIVRTAVFEGPVNHRSRRFNPDWISTQLVKC